MKVRVIEDAPVLIPNQDHQNFTEGKEIIIQGEELTGNPKSINGLRRGQPFTYKLFLTDNNQLIYLKKIKSMEDTETISGADATVVNLKQTALAKPGILGALAGGVIAFGYAKYKKHETKKLWAHVAIGAVAGFIIGKVIAHTGVVKTVKK